MATKNKPVLKSTTTAYATVKLKVRCGSYGPECNLDQILRQASSEAEDMLRNAFASTPRVQVLGCEVVDGVTSVERK